MNHRFSAMVCSLLFGLFLLPTHSLFAQTPAPGIPDSFTVWTTNWDNESVEEGFTVIQWLYETDLELWTPTIHPFEKPEILLDENYTGDIHDMAIDLFRLKDDVTLHGIFAVSKGDSFFPSAGTEFQHRVINEAGNWESVQDPIFTTPADVSPLGLDVYWLGEQLRIVWIEDSDVTSIGNIYDQALSVNDDGTLELIGEPTLVYSQNLNWSGTSNGNGGLNGVTAVDYDRDGDRDFIISQMFYGDDPTSNGFFLVEQTAPGEFAESIQELIIREVGSGAEALTAATVDDDDNLDLLATNHIDGSWDQIYWYEQTDNGIEEVGLLIDTSFEGNFMGLSFGHMFGVYASEPPAIGSGTSIHTWSLF